MVYMFIAIIAIAIYMCYKGCHGVIKISRKNAGKFKLSNFHLKFIFWFFECIDYGIKIYKEITEITSSSTTFHDSRD